MTCPDCGEERWGDDLLVNKESTKLNEIQAILSRPGRCPWCHREVHEGCRRGRPGPDGAVRVCGDCGSLDE